MSGRLIVHSSHSMGLRGPRRECKLCSSNEQFDRVRLARPCRARFPTAALMSDETREAVQKARDMLEAGIKIQATGEATNAIVAGIIRSLLDHIDELEADLKVAIAVGRMAAVSKLPGTGV